ncbi:MAG: ABC transporter permease [Bacteroidota bacterium]
MFRNYIKIALRNLIKSKGFSFINVFGLALGTICCLYILLYVKTEYSYDQHHEAADQIYRVTTRFDGEEAPTYLATASPPIAAALKEDFAEVEEAFRFVRVFDEQQLFRFDNRTFYESAGVYADAPFFDVFDYDFVYGNAQNVLDEPFKIVLSEVLAQKIFGKENPVGKTIELETGDGWQPIEVTAVVSDKMGRSHVEANYFLSMDSGGVGSYAVASTEWSGNNFTNTYVKLAANTSAANLEQKLPDFLESHAAEQLAQRRYPKHLGLQAIGDIHTNTLYQNNPTEAVSPTLLSILLIIAILIQLIACINFMNLSTARAIKRAKEIGVRKVVGARRQSLIGQFLAESLVVAFIATLVAIPVLRLTIPMLNEWTGVTIASNFLSQPIIWVGILSIGLLTGLLAGSYPAFYLSGFQPLKILKSKGTNLGGHLNLRQALVSTQFVLAIGLIIAVIVINAQLTFIQQQDLGYNPSQKIVIPFRTNEATSRSDSYKSSIAQLASVESISRANNFPSQFVFNDINLYKQGSNSQEAELIQFMITDEAFRSTLDIDLLQGRDFRQTDTTGRVDRILVNQSMLTAFNLEEKTAVGKHLYSRDGEEEYGFEIVGVIRDFNFGALYERVQPFMLVYDLASDYQQMIISAKSEDYASLIGQLEQIWATQITNTPFEYTFIDEEVQQLYEADRRFGRIINSFTFLAILISSLGLLGLVMFAAERRKKEIGIRKVLGASVPNIITLLSKDFLKPIVFALLIASPVAWYVMRQWLDNFAYQTDIKWWFFALAAAAAVVASLFAVSFQSIRAALANPIQSLRSE